MIYKKSNLEYLTLGKNQIEVEKFLGAPEGRSLINNSDYLWDYRRPFLNEETGEIFEWSLLTFRFTKGKCSSVDVHFAHPPAQLLEADLD